MRYFGLLFLAFLAFNSCSNSQSEALVEEVSVNEDVVADAKSHLAIEGMVCSMGCVSAIQDKLRSTLGVASAVVNYDESYATIEYDSKLVNEGELIAAVGSIGDHSYSALPFEDDETAEETIVDEEVSTTSEE